MALSATLDWEMRASGATLNGGGFNRNASGTDRSQSATAWVDIDGSVKTAVLQATTTDVFLGGSSPYTVSAADIGNIVFFSSGALTAGHYEIVAVNTGTNVWTLDRSAGATAGLTGVGKMGGAKLQASDFNGASTPLLAGHVVYCQGNFTITSAAALSLASVAIAGVRWVGYVTTRGDGSATNRSVWTTSGASVTQLTLSNGTATGWTFEYIKFDGASASSSRGFTQSAGQAWFKGCEFTRFTNGAGAVSTGTTFCLACDFTSCATANVLTLTGPLHLSECRFALNTSGCINVGASARLNAHNCLWFGNTGALTDGVGVTSTSAYVLLKNCTIDGCGRYGVSTGANNTPVFLLDCLLTNNATNSVQTSASPNGIYLESCATYNNAASGLTASQVAGAIALTGDPYSNRAGGDFRLNATAGAGLACQATGYPAAINGFATSRNVGAFDVPSGGGSAGILVTGGMSGGIRG